MRFRTLDQWLAWQESLHPRAIDLGLERVRQVAGRLGVGKFTIPVVTVAGTNGKGSCVAMLDAILRAGGYRVGAFTSPHLIRYNERIRIDGREITDAGLIDAFARIDAARGAVSLTFFEFNTLAALLAFQDAALDAVILEVGLGGRLDAVNIVDADVALLTSIGLDHCDWLGGTLEAIGREKAGIFRAGHPAVLGSRQVPDSVREYARRIGAPLREPDIDFATGRGDLPRPALPGAHQLENAAAVLAVIEALRERLPVTREAIVAGLRNVELPGRFQCVPGTPEWILDVAHNPDAAERLSQTLATLPARGRTMAVVGILKDKDAPAIVAPLRAGVAEWIAVDLPGPRGLTGLQLREACGAAGDAHWSTAPSVAAACQRAQQGAGEGDRVVVFGSFFTVGPALEWLAR